MRELDYRSSSHRTRHTSRSKSRDRDRDRDRDYYSRRKRSKSRSRASKSKKKKSKKKRYRRSSSSSSSSSRSRGSIRSAASSVRKTSHAASAGDNPLSSVQAPKESSINVDVPEKSTLDKIDEDSFIPKAFYSTAESKKISEKVIINLKDDTISVEGKVDEAPGTPEQSEIFHPNFLGDDSQKMEKWVKKLYNYRQKAFED